jgi:hypothetical protein
MTEKLSISGLKLSEPLISIWVQEAERHAGRISLFCRLLAEHHINMAFVISSGALDAQPALCCIDPADQATAAECIERSEALKGAVRFGGTVGIITFYPHHASLQLMGMALQVFGRNDIAVLGLSSSIAALSFVVDFDRLNDAGRLLSETFALPANVSPPRAGFKIVQERRPT